ncbi:RluA family pseudouridine synthase [Streptococcus intermedius]|uniref:RluA family pseudouridine synthase n=1 Tax=Streptococcus intermedius TaxID=1338 RepID=UPI000F65A504|nr:RluA family pseudouridine synthase [Streptococcus intermedius]RSJ20066.1 Ribosomal large subunit pseudouridine synthase C [Streptococcus intermedius]
MHFTIKIPQDLPEMTVKELLEEHFLIPRKIRHFLRIKKHVLINQASINWQSIVHPSDEITLMFDEEDYPEKSILMGKANLVEELYQDEHIIIVNKPEGMKTHANEPTELALLNHVSAYVGNTCYVVHRLDKETSGAVLFAKNPFILPILNRLLEDKNISREYWALVQGTFLQKSQTYTDKIGRDRHDRRKRLVDNKNGRYAETHVTRLKEFRNKTLVNCQLKTGRTHQIRVHLTHHGYPIIGDPLYNPQRARRLMLHAHRLTFTHPFTLEKISVEAFSESFEEGLKEEN